MVVLGGGAVSYERGTPVLPAGTRLAERMVERARAVAVRAAQRAT